MKTVHAVLMFAVLGGVLSSKFLEEYLLPSDKECIKELGLEVQFVLDSVDDNFLSVEGEPKINEYTECSYRKLNTIDENNEIKFEEMKQLFASYIEAVEKSIVDKDRASSDAVEFCKTVEGTDLGDRLVKFSNCAVKKIKNI